jgi:hypothetical protein
LLLLLLQLLSCWCHCCSFFQLYRKLLLIVLLLLLQLPSGCCHCCSFLQLYSKLLQLKVLLQCYKWQLLQLVGVAATAL